MADAQTYRDDAEFARFLPHVPQPFTTRDAEAFFVLNVSEPPGTSSATAGRSRARCTASTAPGDAGP